MEKPGEAIGGTGGAVAIQILLWTLYAVVHFFASVPAVQPNELGMLALMQTVRAGTGCALSLGALPLLTRLYEAQHRARWAAIAGLVVAVTFAWMILDRVTLVAIAAAIQRSVPWHSLPRGFELEYLLVILVWTTVSVGTLVTRRNRTLREDLIRHQLQAQEARLQTARGVLLRNRPDVIFLDINLGGPSGFDLLDAVDAETAVIFATAYDEFAVRAFEESALDYLLKPIEALRLSRSIEPVRKWLADRQSPDASTTPDARPFTPRRWIFLDIDAPEFLDVALISCIQAERGNSRIITKDGRTRIVQSSLQDWLKKVPAEDFVMLHRSTIANLKHVQRVERWSNYSYRVHVAGLGEPVIMSRRYSGRLREFLG